MTELTLGYLDNATGSLLLDDELPGSRQAQDDLAALLGAPTGMGCANPNVMQQFADEPPPPMLQAIRVSGFWHNSLVEGPGRRSVVRMQGCPIRCVGCWVPETWDAKGGQAVSIESVATALLDPEYERDGVTILGGEPFAQPFALAGLVGQLKLRGIHITVYTGYTLERLRATTNERDAHWIGYVLDSIDVLIDGPYVKALAGTAGPWTGSGNQRIHYLR